MDCLKTYPTKCVAYSGQSYPELGIYQGQTMDEVLSIFINLLQRGEVSTSDPAFSSPQVDAARVSDTQYDYNLGPDTFQYSFKQMMRNLPSGYSVAHKGVTLYSGGVPLASSRSTESVLKLPSTSEPVTVRMDMTVQTEETILQYQDSFLLPSLRGDYQRNLRYLNQNEIPEDPAEFQKVVTAELQLLKKEVFERTSSTPASSAELSELRKEVEQLKSDS